MYSYGSHKIDGASKMSHELTIVPVRGLGFSLSGFRRGARRPARKVRSGARRAVSGGRSGVIGVRPLTPKIAKMKRLYLVAARGKGLRQRLAIAGIGLRARPVTPPCGSIRSKGWPRRGGVQARHSRCGRPLPRHRPPRAGDARRRDRGGNPRLPLPLTLKPGASPFDGFVVEHSRAPP